MIAAKFRLTALNMKEENEREWSRIRDDDIRRWTAA